jgi:hypothetical protein
LCYISTSPDALVLSAIFTLGDMQNNELLTELMRVLGTATRSDLAGRFAISRNAVHKWARRWIPEDRALEIEELTLGRITVYDVLTAARTAKGLTIPEASVEGN